MALESGISFSLEKRNQEIVELLKTLPKGALWVYFPRSWGDWIKPEGPDVDMAYICFNGALFISSLWMRPKLDNPQDISWIDGNLTKGNDPYIKGLDKLEEITIDKLSQSRGVYQCQLWQSIEDHGFVIYITEDKVTVYSSYSGSVDGKFYVKIQKREDWFDNLKDFFTLSSSRQFYMYPRLFGIDPEQTEFMRGRMVNDGERAVFEKILCEKVK